VVDGAKLQQQRSQEADNTSTVASSPCQSESESDDTGDEADAEDSSSSGEEDGGRGNAGLKILGLLADFDGGQSQETAAPRVMSKSEFAKSLSSKSAAAAVAVATPKGAQVLQLLKDFDGGLSQEEASPRILSKAEYAESYIPSPALGEKKPCFPLEEACASACEDAGCSVTFPTSPPQPGPAEHGRSKGFEILQLLGRGPSVENSTPIQHGTSSTAAVLYDRSVPLEHEKGIKILHLLKDCNSGENNKEGKNAEGECVPIVRSMSEHIEDLEQKNAKLRALVRPPPGL